MRYIFLYFLLISNVTLAQTITWSMIPGPNHGGTAFVSNSANTKLYKGASSGYGVMMSVDSGYTWVPISPYDTGAWGLIMKGDTLVASFVQCNSLVGMHYTVDDGQNWVYMSSVTSGAYDLACNASTIYLADGIYTKYTSDWGATWQYLNTPHTYTTGDGSYSVKSSGNNVVVGSTNGVYISNDNGQTWSFKPIPNTGIAWSVYINGNTIFAGTNIGLHKSFDGGNTWTQQANLNNQNVIAVDFFGNIGFISAIHSQSGSNPPEVYVGPYGGSQWILSNNYIDPSQQIRAFYKIGDDFICGGTSALYHGVVSGMVSLPEFTSEKVNFYPNPVVSDLTVQLNENSNFIPFRAEWINILGEVAKEDIFDSGNFSSCYTLNRDNLKSGIYILRIFNERGESKLSGKVNVQ